MQRNYVLMIVCLSFISNYTCSKVSKLWGKTKFVSYVNPNLRVEGVIASMIMSTFFSYLFFVIAEQTEGEFLIAKIDVTEYLAFGVTSGFLALMGNLLTKFLRRCANLQDDDNSFNRTVS